MARRTLSIIRNIVLVGLILSFLTSVALNISFIAMKFESTKSMLENRLNHENTPEATATTTTVENSDGHELAGLHCEKYGGPEDEFAEEMVYWEDIPEDSKVVSPFRDPDKYLTFEPDFGGWNNIRMAMETVLVLAHAMGRTLVLPPEAPMYLLNKGGFSDKKQFTFADFFHLDTIHKEHEGLDIITMEEFLTRQGMNDKLVNFETGEPFKPPGFRVNWDGMKLQPLWSYLRNVGHVHVDWDPYTCTAVIPASKDPNDILELKEMEKQLQSENVLPENYDGKPVAIDGPTIDRLKENSCSRKKFCIYDEEMQNKSLIHFQTGVHGESAKKLRLLTHFYSFVFFQDWKQDLWTKRFVRDHMRYADEIVCAAAKVVKAMRDKAKLNEKDTVGKGINGIYDAMHIRRGDFQYKVTRLDAPELLDRSKVHLAEGTTLYIATDERDKSFFKPLTDYYTVYFLDDFMDLLKGVNTNYFGMIDQLIASKSDIFFGTWFSTFSGYINRVRGYHSTKAKLPGYQDGTLKSWYFIPEDRIDEMQMYKPVRLPLYMREFPTSWRNIDYGLNV